MYTGSQYKDVDTIAEIMASSPKTFFIKNYGCQMNELDADIMRGILLERGLSPASEEEADLLIFNTCSVRDLAERKAMGKIGRLGKKPRSGRIIGITGCMANAKKESLFQKLPGVNFVLGTNNLHELNLVLDDFLVTGQPVSKTDPRFYHELDYTIAQRSDPYKAHVSIIRGCDKFCTYCVVPYTRGPEVSRSPEDIIEECQQLSDKGYREITLLGQNVNSYGKDRPDWGVLFPDLLSRLDQIKGIDRIRFLTSHPVDITLDLMYAVRDLPSLCHLVHFPMQAGSSRILKKMHRIYTIEEYLEKVAHLKSIVKNVCLGTDIIVGFPTETNEEFLETKRLMEEIEFSVAFIYAYSPRKGTPAMRWADCVPEEEKQRRLQELLQLQEKIYHKERLNMVGQEVELLIEKVSEKSPGFVSGQTRCWKNMLVLGDPSDVGSIKKARITGFNNHTLLGTALSA